MWRALLLCAASAAAASYCERLHTTGNRTLGTKVTLVWGAAPAHAAAALLRAALLAAGAPPAAIVLRPEPRAADLCRLLAARLPPAAAGEVVLALAAAWRPTAHACSWADAAGGLRVQGAGAAPAVARLHVRLAPVPEAARACAAADTWPFYENASALRECGFVVTAPRTSEMESAVVYVLEGEWEDAGKALRKDVSGVRLQFVRVTRAGLAHAVAKSARSFLFLDADLWRGVQGVRPAEPPNTAAAAEAVSLRVADEYNLHIYAAALHAMFSEHVFVPRGADLRAVLERATDVGGDPAEAACMLASDPAAPDAPSDFARWRDAVGRKTNYLALAVFCMDEVKDLDDYEFAVKIAGRYVDESIRPHGLIIQIPVIALNCKNKDSLSRELLHRMYDGTLVRTVFVVASADLVREAALYTKNFGLPLLAYDVTPNDDAAAPPSATGRADHLAFALRRLLAACSWRRLAVLSEPTRLAAALRDALELPAAGVAVRWANVTADTKVINETLSSLVDADARVFLINTGARTAAAVLAAALARGLTPARGYAWIVLEYGAADAASAALKPCSVSLQWRGATEASPAPRGRPTDAALRALEEEWRSRAWPRHATGMVNAILTLGEGYRRIVERRRDIMDFAHSRKDKLSLLRILWKEIQSKNISGIIENMAYDERGVATPLVFVDRWGADSRPARLATWPAGERGPRDEECPATATPPDGTVACLTRSGDDFQPSCHDVAWGCLAAALPLAVAMLALAGRRARAALRRRDACIRAAVAARMLARRSRVFAALAPHLVERAALDLHEELGAGSFGSVRLGLLRTPGRDRPVVVAAKALRDDAAPAAEMQFLKEACTLAALDHEHVVRFTGVCVEDGPPLLLMEHAFFGDLLRYLQARRHLAEGAAPGGADAAGPEEAAYVSAEALTRLAHEAAAALAYLAARRLVHRDVRASNCLVDARRRLKLADFGLARETGTMDGEYACRSRAMFPVLRMPPESLAHGVCSAASDVWAFGVLALELVTLGARPYGDASPSSVVRLVTAGGRPPLPRDASADTRVLVRACWRREPGARPAAARLAAWLTARRRALAPALAAELDDMDADSGFGEPAGPFDGDGTGPACTDAADAVPLSSIMNICTVIPSSGPLERSVSVT